MTQKEIHERLLECARTEIEQWHRANKLTELEQMSKVNETVELLDYIQTAIRHKMSKLDAKSAEYEHFLRLDVAFSFIENAVLCYAIDKKGTFLQGGYEEMENRKNGTL